MGGVVDESWKASAEYSEAQRECRCPQPPAEAEKRREIVGASSASVLNVSFKDQGGRLGLDLLVLSTSAWQKELLTGGPTGQTSLVSCEPA